MPSKRKIIGVEENVVMVGKRGKIREKESKGEKDEEDGRRRK